MRDTLNASDVELDYGEYRIIDLSNIPEFDIPEYDLEDPKELLRYLDDIKRICHNSRSYKKYTKFLRESISMDECSFFKNVNNRDTFKIAIHIHHEPFTLPDIISIVFNKRVANGESLSVFMVAKEVMYLHYCLLVGLIPLSETVHELVHNSILYIPLNKVLGQVHRFVQMYEPYIDPDLLDKLTRNIEFTKAYNQDLDHNIHVLNKNHIYLQTGYDLPTYDEIISNMNNKIKEIQEGRTNNK